MTAVTQAGQITVLAALLSERFDVMSTIEPESGDESRRLAVLLSQIADALAVVRRPDGVNIDSAHFRLTGG